MYHQNLWFKTCFNFLHLHRTIQLPKYQVWCSMLSSSFLVWRSSRRQQLECHFTPSATMFNYRHNNIPTTCVYESSPLIVARVNNAKQVNQRQANTRHDVVMLVIWQKRSLPIRLIGTKQSCQTFKCMFMNLQMNTKQSQIELQFESLLSNEQLVCECAWWCQRYILLFQAHYLHYIRLESVQALKVINII